VNYYIHYAQWTDTAVLSTVIRLAVYILIKENTEFAVEDFSVSCLITQMQDKFVMRESIINISKIF